MLNVLQAGRGIAALMVVLFHLNLIFSAEKYWGQSLWSGFTMGHAGVDFFFVLSGFIITYIHLGQAGDVRTLPDYMRKRFVRIYPVYWVALALVLASLLFFQGLAAEADRTPFGIITSILLLPTPDFPHLGVAWTLRHEVLFYILFAAVLVNRAFGLLVLSAWFAGCAVWTMTGGGSFPGNFFLSTYNLLFLMGMAAAWAVGRWRIPAPVWLAAGGVGLFVLAGVLDVAGAGTASGLTLLYGAGSALAVLGFVELERSRNLATPKPLQHLGDASYSLYLIHYVLLSAGAKLIFMLGLATVAPYQVTAVLLLLAVCIGGLVFHQVVEQPLRRWLRPRRSPAQTTPPPGHDVGSLPARESGRVPAETR